MKEKAFQTIIKAFVAIDESLHKISLYDTNTIQYEHWLQKHYTFLQVDDLYKITKLDLSYSSLNYLPSAFGYLSTLESLDLSGNSFTELPEWIWNLSNLKILTLGSAVFGGNHIQNISSNIKNLKNLEMLDIRYNEKLQGVPQELLELDQFLYLSLTQEHIYHSDIVGKLREHTKCSILFEETLPPIEDLLR